MRSMFKSTHWRQHIALDVGTAMTRIATGQSSLAERPSLIGCKRALRDGVVVDGEAVSSILEPFFALARRFGILKPCVLACAPSNAKDEERQMLTDSIMKAGAFSVSIIPEPLAAAIGSGLDVSSPYAQMVIDIGEGVTDCAVIRSSKILVTSAIKIGCGRMRQAIENEGPKYGYVHIGGTYADILCCTGAGSLARPNTQAVCSLLQQFNRYSRKSPIPLIRFCRTSLMKWGVRSLTAAFLLPAEEL
ncbi:hypothetical protein GSUET_06260 [Geobacter sulfurreducens subsp. ethanolicus]|nr:hypothetical protein GSUET_06260 [Geobacter sulfurreducens subsp. ethanolicus]